MRVVFMGTSEFATPSLRALIQREHQVVGVWTRPDKPHGRGRRLDASPVKRLVMEAELPLFQPGTLKRPENAAEVAALNPDIICVAAYGLLLPPAVLEMPLSGCVNVHASLLPRYRGAAPIHRAIMGGEPLTGVTTMMMNAGLDTGDILLEDEVAVGPDDTYGVVHDLLAQRGATLLLRTLDLLQSGSCPRRTQDESAATYAPPVRKEECAIDWGASAPGIHNLVRGTNPRPGAFCYRNGEILRIHQTIILQERLNGGPGALHRLPGRRGPAVSCGGGAVELSLVQPAGKKPMSGFDYLLGRPAGSDEYLTGRGSEGGSSQH